MGRKNKRATTDLERQQRSREFRKAGRALAEWARFRQQPRTYHFVPEKHQHGQCFSTKQDTVLLGEGRSINGLDNYS